MKAVEELYKGEKGNASSDLVGAFLGDSSLSASGTSCVAIAANLLGLAEYKNYAVGGHTWATQLNSSQAPTTCVRTQVVRLLNDKLNGFNPDFIFINCGGNDLWLTNKLGSLTDAFNNDNYKVIDDTTTYGGIRYNIEDIRRNFPNAILIVGTTFQRVGKEAAPIANAIREVAEKYSLPLLDGYKNVGISPHTEFISPSYTDAPSGTPTREYPRYNWVELDGTVVSVDAKTDDAIKRYGLYTYDGTHQNILGEERVGEFIANSISSTLKLNV